MVERTEPGGDGVVLQTISGAMNASEVDQWFVREVLPLEATLMHFLRRNWRNKADHADLCQEVYVRVYEAALQEIPAQAKPFVLSTARTLLIDHVRREHVISIEAVADLDTLGVGTEEVSPDRVVIAREELRRLQDALDLLPPRCREAVVLRQVEGLSRREIAERMGISEETVKRHLAVGACALADTLYGETSGQGRKP
jgi:RNA polymerase sigma-70 factor (ECF subfamily)